MALRRVRHYAKGGSGKRDYALVQSLARTWQQKQSSPSVRMLLLSLAVSLLLVLVAFALLTPAGARAETRAWVFDAGAPPDELYDTANAVAAEDVEIRLTFAGDCTLGDEASYTGARSSFSYRVGKEGMAYPFSLLEPIFADDDFTVVNLEGVLSDSSANRVKKQYNFRGSTEYTQVLTSGSVECVSLANNHILDYGARGEADTKRALDMAGIGRFDERTLCVLEKDGVRVGFTATLFSLGSDKERELAAQMQLLRDLGCAAIVHSMHAGTEYAGTANARQQSIAETAVQLGATLVVGHHPHVPQNISVIGKAPVVYSLGNCCFGGNTSPKKRGALVLSVELDFASGGLQSLDWTLHPIYISDGRTGNDYRPLPMDDDNAASLMKRVQGISGIPLLPYIPGAGARQSIIIYAGQQKSEE